VRGRGLEGRVGGSEGGLTGSWVQGCCMEPFVPLIRVGAEGGGAFEASWARSVGRGDGRAEEGAGGGGVFLGTSFYRSSVSKNAWCEPGGTGV